MKNEKDVKKKVKALLNKFDWYWWMIPANGFGQSGVSDFHALKNDVFIAIETKFGSNKPTALQVAFLNSIRAEGAFAFVVNDKNIDWFEAFLESFAAGTGSISEGQKVDDEHGARMLNAINELSNKILDVSGEQPTVN